ncbi:hypothetical protein F4810DRAFT_79405 [Camillea tinctor]|nr:hypothetical protein F4810DRAFT_79405 [Camillea tinctor]
MMTAPTLTVTVSPAVESTRSFRSPSSTHSHPHSHPHSHTHTHTHTHIQHQHQHQQQQDPAALALLSGQPIRNRSYSTQSLPELSSFDLPAFDFDSQLDTSFSFNPDSLNSNSKTISNSNPNSNANSNANSSSNSNLNSQRVGTDTDVDTDEKSRTTTVTTKVKLEGPRPRVDKMGKRRTMLSRPQSWMPSSRSAPEIGAYVDDRGDEGFDGTREDEGSKFLTPNLPDRSRNVSDTFASLARRTWMPSSRSPSPRNRNDEEDKEKEKEKEKDKEKENSSEPRTSRERSASNSSIMKLRKASRKRSGSYTDSDGGRNSSESGGRLGNYLTRIKPRSQAAQAKAKSNGDLDSASSSTTSLAPPSTDTRRSHASETSNSTYPEETAPTTKMPLVRDPLWSAFKGLDAEFNKFQGKSIPMKMTLIRSVLAPFLRKYAAHPSNKILHYEDLERRATVLNKWWGGLLEMLEAKSQPPVSGVDRPTLLEVMGSLMMRPEWRQSTPEFCALADRNPRERLRRRSCTLSNESSSSVESTDSVFLARSTGHNVRTMFVANLITQMAIVVDKLALRHAPLSLINFAGKACAYAFFFAPGIADVLVRLWSLTPDLLRRVADEFHLPRWSKGESDDIVSLFPPCIEGLGWTSVKTMSSTLRQASKPPLPASKIPWRGPWVSRWNGRDSDLFFIFCKYYYILAEEFMPQELPLVEKARAPGFVLVNAQILAALDSTIHRQAALEAPPVPLADSLHGADASVMSLQMAPNNNIMRGMTENRLIVLLKDFLSSASVIFAGARHTFAEAFMAIMKATAKRTSQYDHNACFTFCDFLEEALVAYESFIDVQRPDMIYVDWAFWFEVCRRILESNNSMSEIRVLSLIFSIWDTVASNPARKSAICVDWLLTEETFNKLFNNWCPMVRAYYMRLLCWRICRDAGDANETDAKIFLLVSSRLKTTWSHFLWLKQTTGDQGKLPPSTAPSFPTPGKRFMIIRTEVPAVQQGLMVGFDSSPAPQHDVSSSPATDFDSIETDTYPEVEPPKKKWGLFGKMFSFSGSNESNDLEILRRNTAASRSKTALPPNSPPGAASPPGSDSDSMGSSPTYEATQYVFRFMLSWNAAGTIAPPNRILTRPRLPNPAQSWVSSKNPGGSPPPLPASRPSPTRAISGSPHFGLVENAKNANSSEVPSSPPRISMSFDQREIFTPTSPGDDGSDDLPLLGPTSPGQDSIITPVEPKGFFASNVKYTGRALAEWSLVVAECNSFVDRRREEGVLGLNDVEVPALGVEGFRKLS